MVYILFWFQIVQLCLIILYYVSIKLCVFTIIGYVHVHVIVIAFVPYSVLVCSRRLMWFFEKQSAWLREDAVLHLISYSPHRARMLAAPAIPDLHQHQHYYSFFKSQIEPTSICLKIIVEVFTKTHSNSLKKYWHQCCSTFLKKWHSLQSFHNLENTHCDRHQFMHTRYNSKVCGTTHTVVVQWKWNIHSSINYYKTSFLNLTSISNNNYN